MIEERKDLKQPRPPLVFEVSAQNKYDIGNYINNIEINDGEKEHLLRNTWNPDLRYKFEPQIKGTRKRTFQLSWLQRYKWLAYSDLHKGAFCKNCVIFGPFSGTGKGAHQVPFSLIRKPYTNWKDAIEDFENHSRLKYHRDSTISVDNFLQTVSGRIPVIDLQINQQANQTILDNRRKLKAIVETILFCGRQEIPLRGHKDSGRLSIEEPTHNDGNFRALLRFRATHGDEVLKDHIETSGGKSFYTSPIVQNEIINIIGKRIQSEILVNIKRSKYYTILADETTDIQRLQQFSLCIRYVDEDILELKEDFLTFVAVGETTGASLAKSIKEGVNSLGLDLQNMRGQGYDGASSMRGAFNGVQALLKNEYPLAVYTHCAAHCLNLCLNDSSRVKEIRNCFGVISEVCNFFRASPRRTSILRKILEKSPITSKQLMKYCETRWVERHEAVQLFADSLLYILQALENICDDEKEDSPKAQMLQKSVSDFKFLIALQVSEKMLGLTYSLSAFLQAKYVDLSRAMQQVELVLKKIEDVRKDCDKEFNIIFSNVSNTGITIGAVPHIPRRVGVQTNRDNHPGASPEEYYRRTIFIPYLDELQSSLKERFLAHKNTIVALQCVVPVHCVKSTFDDLKPALLFYEKDLIGNKAILQGEWEIWMQKWKENQKQGKELPKYAMNALKECEKDLFPNIYTLLSLLATIPVSTAAVERSFSTLKRLKTYLRNSTGEDRLTGLALMSIHRSSRVDLEHVINEFAKKNRKMLLK